MAGMPERRVNVTRRSAGELPSDVGGRICAERHSGRWSRCRRVTLGALRRLAGGRTAALVTRAGAAACGSALSAGTRCEYRVRANGWLTPSCTVRRVYGRRAAVGPRADPGGAAGERAAYCAPPSFSTATWRVSAPDRPHSARRSSTCRWTSRRSDEAATGFVIHDGLEPADVTHIAAYPGDDAAPHARRPRLRPTAHRPRRRSPRNLVRPEQLPRLSARQPRRQRLRGPHARAGAQPACPRPDPVRPPRYQRRLRWPAHKVAVEPSTVATHGRGACRRSRTDRAGRGA